MNTYILKGNLMAALQIAINDQEAVEKGKGFTNPSSFLAGLKSVLNDIRAGMKLEVKE